MGESTKEENQEPKVITNSDEWFIPVMTILVFLGIFIGSVGFFRALWMLGITFISGIFWIIFKSIADNRDWQGFVGISAAMITSFSAFVCCVMLILVAGSVLMPILEFVSSFLFSSNYNGENSPQNWRR